MLNAFEKTNMNENYKDKHYMYSTIPHPLEGHRDVKECIYYVE